MAFLNGNQIFFGLNLNEINYDIVDSSLSLSSERPVQNKVISQAIMIEDEANGKYYLPTLKIINGKPKMCLIELSEEGG